MVLWKNTLTSIDREGSFTPNEVSCNYLCIVLTVMPTIHLAYGEKNWSNYDQVSGR